MNRVQYIYYVSSVLRYWMILAVFAPSFVVGQVSEDENNDDSPICDITSIDVKGEYGVTNQPMNNLQRFKLSESNPNGYALQFKMNVNEKKSFRFTSDNAGYFTLFSSDSLHMLKQNYILSSPPGIDNFSNFHLAESNAIEADIVASYESVVEGMSVPYVTSSSTIPNSSTEATQFVEVIDKSENAGLKLGLIDVTKSSITPFDTKTLGVPPVIESRSPEPDETKIAPDANITVKFDHKITLANPGLITMSGPDGMLAEVNLSVKGSTLTLKHSGLAHHTPYTVSIGENALENQDGIGNELIEWGFTTVMSPPQAKNPSPHDGATHVGLYETMSLLFSQDVQLADASKITIESGNGSAPAEIHSELSRNILTISHSGLENLTEYTITIPGGTVQNTDEIGNEKFVWNFTSITLIPEPVVTGSPSGREGSVALDAGFEWQASPYAKFYRIQLSNTENFEDLVADADELTGLSFTPDTLLSDYRTYYWRVRAANDAGESEWSEVQQFTTIANQPAAVFPMMNAENISTAPMPEWTSDYETSYRLQLANSEQFSQLLANKLTPNETLQLTGLDEHTTYFWRVRVETDSTTSPWSEPMQFKTRTPPSSNDNEQVVEQNISFGNSSNHQTQGIKGLDYRLIGLPGNDHHRVDQIFSGDYGKEWKAFYENSGDIEFYDEYDSEDDRFVFAPGRAFWVLSTEIKNLQLKISSVETNEKDAYSIPLKPGWNIITNPHHATVSWNEVQHMNNFNGNAWGYDQRFVQADSLFPVQGYYLYNHPDHPLESLDIPYATMEQRRSGKRNKQMLMAATKDIEKNQPMMRLSAEFDTLVRFETDILFAESEQQNHDEEPNKSNLQIFYPSLEMSQRGMMLVNEQQIARGGLLREVSPYDKRGSEFELHLKGKVGSAFTWKLDLQQLPDQSRVLLVNRANSQSWMMKNGDEIESVLTEPNAVYTLYTGDEYWLEVLRDELMPQEFALEPNYPNPFNPVTNIRYSLPEQQHVRLEIYDVIGRRVQVLTNDVQQAGWHVVQFDGSRMASGVYLYRLTTENSVKVRKMTLVK